jgi:hypothetical protein
LTCVGHATSWVAGVTVAACCLHGCEYVG